MSRLIDFNEVQSRTGNMSKATYWRLRLSKKFPEPVAVSKNRKAWHETDIENWIKSRAPNTVDRGSSET